MRKFEPAKASYLGLDQRIAPRSDVYVKLAFVMPDGRQELATMVNISADGLLMRFPRAFEVGDMLMLKLPVIGRLSGRVIWSMAGKTGVQFDTMIPVQDYLPMLKAIGVKPQLQ